MYGYMIITGINHHPFWERPSMTVHLRTQQLVDRVTTDERGWLQTRGRRWMTVSAKIYQRWSDCQTVRWPYSVLTIREVGLFIFHCLSTWYFKWNWKGGESWFVKFSPWILVPCFHFKSPIQVQKNSKHSHRRVDPSDLEFSLSSHRQSYIYILSISHFIVNNKLQ